MTPTPEQLSIIDAAQTTSDHMLVQALAGAAKTSTLVLLAEALSPTPIQCIAFNKAIAVELNERLPANAVASTMHSVGMKVWRSFVGKARVSDDKIYRLSNDWVKNNILGPEQEEWFAALSDYRQSLSLLFSAGWVPDNVSANGKFRSLLTDEDAFATLEYEMTDELALFFTEVASVSVALGLRGEISFDDMVYLPTLHRSCSFPRAEVLMVDEAQDLSPLNHVMIQRILGTKGRLIAVGDPCQAIYGFRGADSTSMATLAKTFSAKTYPLTISFRCPRTVVAEARTRAPEMRYPEWAIEGEVKTLPAWTISTFPEYAAVICRNNAPLFKLALRLMKGGRYVELVGNDLLKRIATLFKKFGSTDMPIEEVQASITLWSDAQRKAKPKATWIDDWTEAMMVLAEGKENLGEVLTSVRALQDQSGRIKLMTAHKSKGLEFAQVFILDRELIKTQDSLQERNLLYVMQTRAQQSLTYITTEGFTPEA